MKVLSAPALVILASIGGTKAHWGASSGGDSGSGSASGCPTDSSIDKTCLDAVLPPWPICLKKSAQEWVAHAQDSATRCCPSGGDDCRCPVKDGDAFKSKIVEHCIAIQQCPSTQNSDSGGGDDSGSTGVCPTATDGISQECLDAILPPWPICLSKSAADWVLHAQDAATRCCPDADGSECRCPAKEGDAFQNKIGVYCSAIADDGACSKQDLSAAMKNLRGGIIATGGEKLPDFDREEQVERIAEFAP